MRPCGESAPPLSFLIIFSTRRMTSKTNTYPSILSNTFQEKENPLPPQYNAPMTYSYGINPYHQYPPPRNAVHDDMNYHHFHAHDQVSPVQRKVIKIPQANVIGILYALAECLLIFPFFSVYAMLVIIPAMKIPALLSIVSCLFSCYFWLRAMFDREYLSGKPGFAETWPILFGLFAWIFLWFSIPLGLIRKNIHLPNSDILALQILRIFFAGLGCVGSLFNYYVMSRDDADESCCLFLKPFVMRPVESDDASY